VNQPFRHRRAGVAIGAGLLVLVAATAQAAGVGGPITATHHPAAARNGSLPRPIHTPPKTHPTPP
jgi:hypothetical protein